MYFKSVLIFAIFILGINALNKDKDCSCRLNVQRRILNGRIIPHNTYPWIANVRIHMEGMTGYIGSATILNNNTLLTSGLVTFFFANDEYYENPDLYNKPIFELYSRNIVSVAIKRDGRPEEIHRVAKLIPHSKYRYTGLNTHNVTVQDNVALIQLQSPIQFDDSIRPACLDASEQETYSGPLSVAGYGAFSMKKWNFTDENLPLREGIVFDLSNEDCDTKEGKLMCVNSKKNKTEMCYGDSGSAIHQTRNGKTSVVAIESHDKYLKQRQFKCEGNYASKVSYYISWIQEHIGNNYCQ